MSKFKILLVEDKKKLSDTKAVILKKAGYKVFTAADKDGCLKVILKEKPGLILFDYVLADTNGKKLCRSIKNNPKYSSVSLIILISSDIASEKVMKEFKGIIDGTIDKSVNEQEFLVRVDAECRIASVVSRISACKVFTKACIDSNKKMMILAVDRQFRYQTYNALHEEKMLEAFGEKINTGMNLLECINDDAEREKVKKNIERALSGESCSTNERSSNKNRDYYEVNYNPVYDENNDVIGVVVFCTNVTDIKEMEATLKNAEEKFKKAFMTTPDSVNINRLSDGMYAMVNEGFMKVTGYTEKEAVGKTSIELNIWDDPKDRAKLVAGLKKDGKVENMEYRYLTKKGSVRVGLLSASLIDIDGVPHLLNVTRDITERKKIEIALKKSETMFRELNELAPDGIVLGSHDGLIIGANSHMLNLTGRRLEELIGYNIMTLFSPEELKLKPLKYDLLREGMTVTTERHIVRSDGSIVPIEMRSRMMPDGTFQSIIRDISRHIQIENTLKARTEELQEELEKKRIAEIALQESNKKLESSKLASMSLLENIKREMKQRRKVEDQIKKLNTELEQRVLERTAQLEAVNNELQAFAYSVSHDLRAPLRAIDGFSRFVMEDYAEKLDKEGQRLLGLVRSNTQKMDKLITDILALSRITLNEPRVSKVDMKKMVTSTLNEIAPPEIQQKMSVVVDELPDAYVDSTYMKQVWINLISNAVKFSSGNLKPEIKIGSYTENNFHVYYVKDNGAGFNQEYAHKLFGVFQRLHRTDEFEGTGVGLAIVKRIVHRHGGKVWAEGKEKKGATFYFSIPEME